MNRLVLYTTPDEYSDMKGRWHARLQEVRKMLHERKNTEIVIKLGRGGRVVWKGINHGK